jgi:S-layer protein (TIGR01567 family)
MRIRHLLQIFIIIFLLIVAIPAQTEGLAPTRLDQPKEGGWYLQGEPVITKDEEIDLPPCYNSRTIDVSNGRAHGSVIVSSSPECFPHGGAGTFSGDVTWTPPPSYLKPGRTIDFSITCTWTGPESDSVRNSGLIGWNFGSGGTTIVEGDSRYPQPSKGSYIVPEGSAGDELNVYVIATAISGLMGNIVYKYKYRGGAELPPAALSNTEKKSSACDRLKVSLAEAGSYGNTCLLRAKVVEICSGDELGLRDALLQFRIWYTESSEYKELERSTDGKGECTLEVPKGTWRVDVYASKKGYDEDWTNIYYCCGEAPPEEALTGIYGDVLEAVLLDPIPGTVVTATNHETGAIKTVSANPDGTYFISVPPGHYKVQASAPGYLTSTGMFGDDVKVRSPKEEPWEKDCCRTNLIFRLVQDYGQVADESNDSKEGEIPPESFGFSTGAEHGDGIDIRGQAATGDFEWTARNFAGFYYDPKDDVGTEVLTATLRDGKLRGSQPFGLYYQTTAERQDFAFADWGSYLALGFLGEKHLAGYAQGPSSDSSYIFDRSGDKGALAGGQLLKILLDDGHEETFTTDVPLQLEDGYELVIKKIDIDSDKTFLELYKDGTAVDWKVLTPSKDGASMADKTYYYKKDIGNLKDVIIIAVHFKNAFRGADQDLATVDGLWQLSETPVYVAEGSQFGKMSVQSVTDDSITMANQGEAITLGRNKEVSIMPGMSIRTADADTLRYCIHREITDPGTYEIRSTVETAEYAAWTAEEFAGFYYDLDQDIGTEMLAAEITDGKLAQLGGISYTTQAAAADFKFEDWGSYDAIGFLGEKCFAGYIDGSDSGKGYLFEKSSNKSALAKGQLLKVLIDDNEEQTITSDTPLMLEEGYRLELKAVNPDDGKVFVELHKGDELVNNKMFQPSKDGATVSDKTYFFRNPSVGLVTIAVHFKNAFKFADQDLATIDGIWQISESPISVTKRASFDKLTVSDVTDRSIVMNNKDPITLNRNKYVLLAGDLHIRTADSDILSYYLVKEVSI